MKKFTIFLLTFLFLIGFINVNAQDYKGDDGPLRISTGLQGMSMQQLFCSEEAFDDPSKWPTVIFNIQVDENEPSLGQLRNPTIYWTTDLSAGWCTTPITATNPPPYVIQFGNSWFGMGPGISQFHLQFNPLEILNDPTNQFPYFPPLGDPSYPIFTTFTGSIWFYATIEFYNTTLTPPVWQEHTCIDRPIKFDLVEPPTITFDPEALIGILCDGGNVDLDASIEWLVSDKDGNQVPFEDFQQIEYQWIDFYNGVNNIMETGTLKPNQLPAIIPSNASFHGLEAGYHVFKFITHITDIAHNLAYSCFDTLEIEFYVSEHPEVELIVDLALIDDKLYGVCEYEESIEIVAVNPGYAFGSDINIFNNATSYQYYYTLYINGEYFSHYESTIPAGDGINNVPFTINLSELDICDNEITVTLEVFNTDDANVEAGCIGFDTIFIRVWPRPIITIAPKVQEVCSGEEYEVNGFATPQECGATAFDEFAWTVNATVSGGVVTMFPYPGIMDNILYENSLTTLVTVIDSVEFMVRDNNGCWSLPDTAFITIHPLPVIYLDEMMVPDPVCYNHEEFYLEPVYILDENNAIYVCNDCPSWWKGDGVIEELDDDGDPTGNWIFNPKDAADINGGPGTGNWDIELWFYYTNEFGCTDSAMKVIRVYDLPVIPFEYPEELCARESEFPTWFPSDDYLPSGPITFAEFSIDPPTGLPIDPVTGELFLWGATPGEYVITYIYYDSYCWNFSTGTILVHPLPVIDEITQDVIPCVNQTATLTVHISEPEMSKVHIQWWNMTNPPTYIPAPMGNGVTQVIIGYDIPALYKVIVTNTETQCFDSLEYWVEPTVNPVDTIIFNMLPGPYCNNSIVNLDATRIFTYGFEGTVQNFQWGVCEFDAGGYEIICYEIPLTDLNGQYKIEAGLTTEFVRFYISFNTEGYNCPYRYWSDPIYIIQTIKVDLIGAGIDTVCHGGSVELRYKLSNINPEMPIWYRVLENNIWYEGVNEVHKVDPGSTEIWFTTHPALHTNENGPESYCYAVEVWQYPDPYYYMISPYIPGVCYVTSDCHMVTVLKDPVLMLTCPSTIIKFPTENPVFTANLAGGYGEPYYYWYLNTVLVQEGPENTYELDDLSVLGNLGDYRIDVKATQPYSGCDAELVTCFFSVVCPPMTVEIKGPKQACVGEVVTLIADVVTEAEYTVQWKKGGDYLEGVPGYEVVNNNLVFTVGEDVDLDTYYLEVSNCGCEIKTAFHQLQVIPKTVIWVDNYTICENGAVEVSVNQATFGGNEVYRYIWFDAEGEQIDITYINKRIFNFDEMTDDVTWFSVQTEMLNAVCSSNVAEFKITVLGKLEAVSLFASDTIICVNNTVLFTLGTDENIAEFGTPVYTWWVDGFPTDAPSLDFLNLSFTSLGMHYVNVQITYPDNICEFVTNDIYIEVRELIGVEISGVEEVCMKEGVPEYLTAYVEPYEATDLKYQWYENGLPILGGNAYKYAINSTPGTYTYMVIVTDTLSGCVVQSEPHTVIVDKSPVITGIIAVTKTICLGEQVEFSHIPPINNVTYTWYLDGVAQPGATLNIFTYVFDVPGKFVVKVKATSNVLGCESDLVTVGTITVKAPPTVTIDGPALVCNAVEQAVLQATVNPTAGNYSYQWYLNGDPIDGGTGATQQITNVPNSVPYQYYVIVTDDDSGCEVQSAVKEVTVEQLLTTGITADATEICRGASVTLTANVSGNNFNLQWYATLGTQTYPITGAIYPTLQVTPDQTMTYHFVATQIGSGCESPSNPITITVIQKPDAPVLTATPALVCSGDQVTISTTATGMITWYKNDFAQPFSGPTPFNSITDQPTANHSLTTYTYYATVTTVGSQVSCVSDISAPVTVVVHPIMNWVIDGPETVCTQAVGGAQAILNAIPFGEFETQVGTQYEMTWSYQQGNNPEVILLGPPNQLPYLQIPNNLPVNDPAAPYTFILKVKALGYNCHYTAYHTMHILEQPTVAITVDNPNICIAGTVVATAYPTPASTAYTYVWKLNGVVVPGNTAQMTFAGNFTYGINEITVDIQREFANAACSATFTKTINVLTQPFLEVAQTIMGQELPGMCVGGKVDLLAEILGFDVTQILPNVFTYDWYLDNNPYANQGNALSKVFNTPGIYTFKVQAKTAANIGCFSDFATSTVKVVEQPAVSIYPKDYNLYEVCPGAVIELIAVTNIVDPTIQKGEKYKWNDVPDWEPFTNQIPPHSVTINYAGLKSFFLKAEFENPTCNAATSNTVTFTIADAPKWELSIAPTFYDGGCTGQPIHLSATIKGGVGGANGATIQWWYSLNGDPYQKIQGQAGGDIYWTPVQEGTYFFKAVYTHLNPLSGCLIPDEDGILGPYAVGLSITPKAVFVTNGAPHICTNNPSAPVELEIHFTGTPPFAFCIEDNFGGKKCFTDIHDNPFIYKVNPSKTTEYTITSLEVSSKCIVGTFKPTTVTVVVTDLIVNAPTFETCDGQNEITIIVNSAALVTSFATVIFPGGQTQYVPILPDGSGTSKITIDIPQGLPFGVYDVTIIIDDCEFVVSVVYNHTGTSNNLIHRRYEGINEVLVVSNNSEVGSQYYNGGYNFTSYQWYKNDELIPGATQQWYQDPKGINGKYHVKLGGYRVADGTPVEFSTCPMDYNNTGSVKAYPVPAGVGEPVYVEIDLTAEEMNGAYIDIYDAKGAFINQVKVVSRLTKVDGFKAQGTYFGKITTGTNEIKAVRFLIVK